MPKKLSKTVFVYGFPTTGKTVTAEELRKQGFVVVDSDDFIDEVEVTRTAIDDSNDAWQERYEELHDESLEISDPDVLLTNSWEYFSRRGKPDLAFVRDDPADVVALASARGGGESLTPDIAKKWLQDLPSLEKIVGPLTHLKHGEFMLPVVLDFVLSLDAESEKAEESVSSGEQDQLPGPAS